MGLRQLRANSTAILGDSSGIRLEHFFDTASNRIQVPTVGVQIPLNLRRWSLDRRAESLVDNVTGRVDAGNGSQCFHCTWLNLGDKLTVSR